MPRALCTLCRTHPADLPTALCQACRRQVGRDLTALPDWYAALLERPRRGAGQRVAGTTSPSTPVDAPALDVRAVIRTRLTAWTLHLAQRHGISAPTTALTASLVAHVDSARSAKFAALDHAEADQLHAAVSAIQAMLTNSRQAATELTALDRVTSTDQVTALAEHLTEHVDTLLASTSAADFAGQVIDAVNRAVRTVAPDRPDTRPIGHCPDCGGTVLADTNIPPGWSDQDAVRMIDAWCTGCGDSGVLSWWRGRIPAPEWLPPGRLRVHLDTAHDITVTQWQLWNWSSRGHIRTTGEGRRVLYHVADTLNRARGQADRYARVHTDSEKA